MALIQTTEFNRLLQEAADRKASDLHLIPGEPPTFRIAGELHRQECAPLTAAEIETMATAAVGAEAVARLGREIGNVRSGCGLPGVLTAQLTVARAFGNVTMTVRVCPSAIPDVAVCGLPQGVLDAVNSNHGLVIVAGVTGSGKSTSALSLLDYINQNRAVHICTIEDPILVALTPKQALIQQHEVGTDVPDVLAGMRATMYQDPDVVYISEIRSVEEAQAAVTAAQTGHLVLVVMHGRSPLEVVQRLIDIQPPETVKAFRKGLAEQLRSVSTQLLVRKASGRGRVALYSYATGRPALCEAIVKGEDLSLISDTASLVDQTMDDHARELIDAGAITREAYEAAFRR